MLDARQLDIPSLELEFLAAVQDGPAHVAAFCDKLVALHSALTAQPAAVHADVREHAQAAFAFILAQARIACNFDTTSDEIIRDDDPSSFDSPPGSAPLASLPLFRYMINNICYPYPDSEEKERLVDDARHAGWRDFDKKKCEDWLNRKRHQTGYVAIARKYCDEDLDAMRALCSAVLFGSPDEQAQLTPAAIDDIEDMRELIQIQYEELIGERDSRWIDDLTVGLERTLGHAVPVPTSPHDAATSQECDSSYYSDDDSDTDSDAFDSDVDSDCGTDDDDDDVDAKQKQGDASPPPIIGAKRKISDSPMFCTPRIRTPYRTPSCSSSSSSSSDSASSGASFRSFSGSSVSSASSVEWNEDECARPTKRTRSESFSPEPERTASPANDPTTIDLWSMRVVTPVALSKRKRDDEDLETLARNMKRSRYAALSAAAPSNIPAHHLTSLTDVCTRSWSSVVPFEVLSFSVDSELYTVDCTATQVSADDDGEDEDEDNNLADIIGLCNDPDAPDDATWATVQLHALAQTLTGSRLPMAAELCADTVEVKLEELSPQELSSLGETLATTAESITAEYPLDQSLLLEDDDAFDPPELSDGESSGSSSPDRSPSPPVELESSPERLIADYAMSTRTRKELDTLQHPWFAQMFGQQGLSFFDPNTFRVECNPPPGMMAQESHPDFLTQLEL